MRYLSQFTSIIFSLLLLSTPLAQAQQPDDRTPLGEVLGADGALQVPDGFEGALDASGFQMRTDSTGQPHFRREQAPQASDRNWSSQFGRPGLDLSYGLALAVSGDKVYVGGTFAQVGSVPANSIAVWDTQSQSWSALGDGVTGSGGLLSDGVTDIAVSGDKVYVGGTFNEAGGVSASNVAVWDTQSQSWSALGDGVNDDVYVLKNSGGNLFVGGDFDQAGGSITANGIAQWDGSSWSSLGTGVLDGANAGTVRGIAALGGELYVGGDFDAAGTVATANNIAKWDGSSWSALTDGDGDNGTSGRVIDLAVQGDSVLFAGGEFSQAWGESVNNLAKWDPTDQAVSALGPGVSGVGFVFPVFNLTVDGTDLYVTGGFNAIGIDDANRIARWDTQAKSWSTLGSGVEGSIATHTAVQDGNLFVAGLFYEAGDQPANGVARWDGSGWQPLGAAQDNEGLAGDVITSGFPAATAAASTSGGVYVGGTFAVAGDADANSIARWDGSDWVPLGEGVTITSSGNTFPGTVSAVAVSGDNVYVGGEFNEAGGVSASNVAVWNAQSQSWSALGDGVDDPVQALLVQGSNVFVGGDFTQAGGNTANYVARWDGSSWNALVDGNGDNGVGNDVNALAALGGNLYAGGEFTTAGGDAANYVARWDGTNWSALVDDGGTNGVSNNVESLLPMNDGTLALGGDFQDAGSTSGANRVARWDPSASTFETFGPGFNDWVGTLAVVNDTLYAGGTFTETGINQVSTVAKWNGSSWEGLGSGTNGAALGGGGVLSLAPGSDGSLYVGGFFTRAGDKMSLGFAQYNPSGLVAIEDPAPAQRFALRGNAPNPVRSATTIRYALPEPATVQLDVYDVLGRKVATLVDGERRAAATHAVRFDASDLSAGVYLYRIEAGGNAATRRMVIAR